MVFPRPIITPDAVKKRAGEKDKGGKGIDYLSTETGDEEIKGRNERYAFISGANKADVKDLIRSNFLHWSLVHTSESDKQVTPEFMLYSWATSNLPSSYIQERANIQVRQFRTLSTTTVAHANAMYMMLPSFIQSTICVAFVVRSVPNDEHGLTFSYNNI